VVFQDDGNGGSVFTQNEPFGFLPNNFFYLNTKMSDLVLAQRKIIHSKRKNILVTTVH